MSEKKDAGTLRMAWWIACGFAVAACFITARAEATISNGVDGFSANGKW